jgi:hypothetical protein
MARLIMAWIARAKASLHLYSLKTDWLETEILDC